MSREERLRRFFVKEHRGYRVRREVREMVLFAVHDLLKDSPFSRLDLISCRNLLIYLNREAQKRALSIFHFALRPGGRLFLGSSETVDEDERPLPGAGQKAPASTSRVPCRARRCRCPSGPARCSARWRLSTRAEGGPVDPAPRSAFQANGGSAGDARTRPAIAPRVSWEELHFKLIERFAPPSLIVDREHEIVHVSENAGRVSCTSAAASRA